MTRQRILETRRKICHDDSISYSDVYEIDTSSSHGEAIGGDVKEGKGNTKPTSHRRLNWSPFKTSKIKKEMRQMITSSQKENMCQILGGWEPPETATNPSVRNIYSYHPCKITAFMSSYSVYTTSHNSQFIPKVEKSIS